MELGLGCISQNNLSKGWEEALSVSRLSTGQCSLCAYRWIKSIEKLRRRARANRVLYEISPVVQTQKYRGGTRFAQTVLAIFSYLYYGRSMWIFMDHEFSKNLHAPCPHCEQTCEMLNPISVELPPQDGAVVTGIKGACALCGGPLFLMTTKSYA